MYQSTALVAQTGRDLPAMWETQVWSLDWEDAREGNGNPLQCSCLENTMDREALWAMIRGDTKSQTQLTD